MAEQGRQNRTRSGLPARRAAAGLACVALHAFLSLPASATSSLDINGLASGDTTLLPAVSTGAVTIPAGIGLVNAGGYAATGRKTEAVLFGGGLDVTIAETTGPETGAGGMAADPLAVWHRRRAAQLRNRPTNGPVSLGFSASMLDGTARSVDPDEAGWVFGTRNSAWGAASTLGFWNGRLKLSNELAWSSTDPGATDRRGTARRHRLEADLLRGGPIRLSAHGGWSRVGRDYTAPQGDVTADRETMDGGVTLGWGLATLALGHNRYRENLDRLQDVLTKREGTSLAALTLALNRFRPGAGAGSIRALIPGTVSFQHERGRLRGLPGESTGSFAAGDITDRDRRHDALTLHWPWQGGAATSLTLAQTALDANRPGHETEDSLERTATLTQNLNPDGWTASLSFLLGDTERMNEDDRAYTDRQELTATLGLEPEDGPALSATVILRRSHTDLIDNRDTDVDTSWEAIAAADLTPLLLDDDAADGARLALMFGVKGNDVDADDSGLRRIDLRGGIQAAFSF